MHEAGEPLKPETSRSRQIIGEIIYYVHLPVFVLWVVLFFIPVSWWPGRVWFHFWFLIITVAVEVVSGLAYIPVSGRFDLICPLTLLMQILRGYGFNDVQTYKHSFITEFSERLWFRLSKKTVTILIILSIVLVSCQFFLGFPFV